MCCTRCLLGLSATRNLPDRSCTLNPNPETRTPTPRPSNLKSYTQSPKPDPPAQEQGLDGDGGGATVCHSCLYLNPCGNCFPGAGNAHARLPALTYEEVTDRVRDAVRKMTPEFVETFDEGLRRDKGWAFITGVLRNAPLLFELIRPMVKEAMPPVNVDGHVAFGDAADHGAEAAVTLKATAERMVVDASIHKYFVSAAVAVGASGGIPAGGQDSRVQEHQRIYQGLYQDVKLLIADVGQCKKQVGAATFAMANVGAAKGREGAAGGWGGGAGGEGSRGMGSWADVPLPSGHEPEASEAHDLKAAAGSGGVPGGAQGKEGEAGDQANPQPETLVGRTP